MARRNNTTHGWGARCGAVSDYHRVVGKYNMLMMNTEPVRLTPALCDEFAAAFPGVLGARSLKCAKTILNCTNDLYITNEHAKKLIDAGVPVKSFSVWYNARTKDPVWTNNPEKRFYPSRLTSHDNLHDLWDQLSLWATEPERGWRGSNGWERHGVRFLARLGWWLLNDKKRSCDNWSKTPRRTPLSMPTPLCGIDEELSEESSGEETFLPASEPEPADAHMTDPSATPASPATRTASPATRTASPERMPPPLALPAAVETVARRLEDEIRAAEHMTHAEYQKEHALAMTVRGKMATEQNKLAHAELVWLGSIPALANIDHPLTTDQTWKLIDAAFAAMDKHAYARHAWRGLEYYYEPHPTKDGYRPIGAEYGQRAAQMDHALTRFYNIFDHPRFFIVMPRTINTALSNRPPAARLAFGLQRSSLRIMASWVVVIEREMKKRNLFGELYAALPRVVEIM